MSVSLRARSAVWRLLAAGTLALGPMPACAVFGGHGESTVARGKYYSSGDPRYDEFFIALYKLQVQMAEAPRVPETERQNLQRRLNLAPGSSDADLARRLHEEAAGLSRVGVRLRLDLRPSPGAPNAASVSLRASTRPAEARGAALLSQVELSATHLLRSVGQMGEGETALGQLELSTIGLDADVERTFAASHFGTQSEVKKNLSDSHKLIALMRARAMEVRNESQQLLTTLSKSFDTDDGSLGPPSESKGSDDDAGQPRDGKKATQAAARTRAPTPTARPRLAPRPAAQAPVKAPPAGKATPAPRDFEP